MGKIIAVANQKGGVGKTTTTINLAASLAYLGKKVLIVDFDPQGNATQGIGAIKSQINNCSYDLIMRPEITLDNVVLNIPIPPLHLVPATIALAGSDIELAQLTSGRERLLREKLYPAKTKYDFILIDCPPSLGLLNTNAFTAADSVIIPVQCEYYALEGLTQLLSTIRLVQRLFNKNLVIEGVLLTMFDARTRLSLEVQQEVQKYFKERVYKTYIPRNVRLSEAPSRGQSIFEYDIRSEGAKSYAALAKEVLANNS